MRCPGEKQEYGYPSYGLNWINVFATKTENGSSWSDPALEFSRRLQNVPRTTFLIADASDGWVCPPTRWLFTKQSGLGFDSDKDGLYDSNRTLVREYGDRARYNFFNPRHSKAGNLLFADISVASLHRRDWVTNKNDVWGKPTRP